MIERAFDVPFIADLALREKQIQQNYRPIIAVHKWFARRPGTLFRGLLLAEFVDGDLEDTFYRANDLRGKKVADPFMGGGTPLIEANRLGCDVIGYDINPMAYWIVRQEIEHLGLAAYERAAASLRARLESQVGDYYRTTCLECGSPAAQVKYFLWVKTKPCSRCGQDFDLFPGYLLAENRRHPQNVMICPSCGELTEVKDRKQPGTCRACGAELRMTGPAGRSRCPCPHCGEMNRYPDASQGHPRHRMVAIEYHCPACKPHHQGRFFKKPDPNDLARYEAASAAWRQLQAAFVPDEEIPAGDETDRLHRWGYRRYREMFNERQLLGLELSCRAIAENDNERVRNALATNLSDLLRYQNMLCRYDTMALKSLDVFSVHGFPVGLLQCESNLLGIRNGGGGTNVGSGGWSNIVDKYVRAKSDCEKPFEVRRQGKRKTRVWVKGEWIGDRRDSAESAVERNVDLHCGSSTSATLRPASLDAVLTDPPYFANVQYAELMDFCYVWLRRLVRDDSGAFDRHSTRNENELTGNATLERGLEDFAAGMASVFANMARALKPGAPLAFTYHHNTIEAYLPIAVAILDAGLACTASIPCPAEMSASIHINGTGSSIVDTVFVCRSTGTVPRRLLVWTPQEIAQLVQSDLEDLRAGGVRPTKGDSRCIAHGHLTRLAIWKLRKEWDATAPVSDKLQAVASSIDALGGWSQLAQHLEEGSYLGPLFSHRVADEQGAYSGGTDEVSF